MIDPGNDKHGADDEIITVRMPRGDYRVMRDLIKERKSFSYVRKKLQTFSLSFAAVVVAWMTMGDHALNGLKRLLGIL